MKKNNMSDDEFREFLKRMSPEEMLEILKEQDIEGWKKLKNYADRLNKKLASYQYKLYDKVYILLKNGDTINDPDVINKNLIEEMLQYYIKIEKYEKCEFLTKYKNKL